MMAEIGCLISQNYRSKATVIPGCCDTASPDGASFLAARRHVAKNCATKTPLDAMEAVLLEVRAQLPVDRMAPDGEETA